MARTFVSAVVQASSIPAMVSGEGISFRMSKTFGLEYPEEVCLGLKAFLAATV